jgi:hypothetical protein
MFLLPKTWLLAFGLLALGGCVAYTPAPMAPPSLQQRYDQSWAAAAAAMTDQGVTITAQDRGAGAIRGQHAGVNVTALVQTQPDGNVQVSFETAGPPGAEPGLAKRLREGYLRRMGH